MFILTVLLEIPTLSHHLSPAAAWKAARRNKMSLKY